TPVGIEARSTDDRHTPAPAPPVLNACRHRGEVNPDLPLLVLVVADRVLNACRHRGEVNILARRSRASATVCSTPVGIEARSTRAKPTSGRRAWPVLNACRHRGEVNVVR